MGFHAEEQKKAQCPLYKSMVRSEQSNIFGICCCEFQMKEDKHASSFILRFEDMEKALSAKRIYCDNVLTYPMCKLYRTRQSFSEEVEETSDLQDR